MCVGEDRFNGRSSDERDAVIIAALDIIQSLLQVRRSVGTMKSKTSRGFAFREMEAGATQSAWMGECSLQIFTGMAAYHSDGRLV